MSDDVPKKSMRPRQLDQYPKISIITPSFNQGQFLEETIRSVLDQNYPNLEYIIIDGGSTDNSVEIIKKYEQYLTYWVSEPDRGHGHALNKGFACATGEIMAWINSDDKYLPWTFETVAEVFVALPQVEWIQGNPATWDEKGRLVTSRTSQKNLMDFLIGNYAWIQQESTFWRRSLWEKSGSYIDEELKFMVDGELWSRFFQHSELYRINKIIGGFRYYNTNRSVLNIQKCHLEMKQIIQKMKDRHHFTLSGLLEYKWQLSLYNLAQKGLWGRTASKILSKSFGRLQRERRYYYFIDWANDKPQIQKTIYSAV